jgi:hypothetical protein
MYSIFERIFTRIYQRIYREIYQILFKRYFLNKKMKNYDKKFMKNERILKFTAGGPCNPSVTPWRRLLWYASCVRSELRPVCRGL